MRKRLPLTDPEKPRDEFAAFEVFGKMFND